ncbi:MAG: YitT family protein [Chloroflexi bacterium]|nr:YitT family protein [Chloroflexota bacterium]
MKKQLCLFLRQFNWKTDGQVYVTLFVAALLQAITFNVFLASSRLAPGGVSGLAIIIHSFISTPLGLTQLALAVPMLALGFQFLGRFRFLVRITFLTLVYTTAVDMLAPWLPSAGITTDPLLNALFGGMLGGIGSGLVLRSRTTFAGTGIISRILQLRTGIPLAQLYLLIDGGIITALGFTFGWDNALYSMVMLFVWGLATDYVLEGPSVIRTAFIICDAPGEMAKELMDRLGIGVTSWEGEGMYMQRQHTVLFCTISRADVATLESIVADTEPTAFVVIGQGHQARGGMMHHKRVKPVRKAA